MRKSKPTVDINVHVTVLRVDEANGVISEYEITGDSSQPYIKPDGTIDLDGAGRANLFFQVSNKSPVELTFPDDPANAFWIKKGSQCPSRKGRPYGEIDIDLGSGDELSLSVVDHNRVKGRFTYAICFLDRDKKEVLLDPVIVNSGQGGGGGLELPVLLALFVTVIASLLAAVGLGFLLDTRSKR